jgi:hypothetical protein
MSLILNGVAIANLADNAAVSPLADLYIGLVTGDPGPGGTQLTNEVTYGSYGRLAIVRSPGSPQWTVTAPGNVPTAVNIATATWPICTSGSVTATGFVIGTSLTGAGKVLYRGLINNPIGGLIINPGIAPTAPPDELLITEQ